MTTKHDFFLNAVGSCYAFLINEDGINLFQSLLCVHCSNVVDDCYFFYNFLFEEHPRNKAQSVTKHQIYWI